MSIDNEPVGLYRIGISLDEVRNVESRMYSRIILTTLLLAAIAVIVLSIIFTSQNLKTVSLEYGKFKTFASSVLQNMAEAVIVTDRNFNITLFNDSAERFFQRSREETLGQNIKNFHNGALNFLISKIKSSDRQAIDVRTSLTIDNQEKYLFINIACNTNTQNENENYTFVMNDYTERKKLEEQAGRNEKLAAMGELASGVAHEIRNPINSIGMIAQRLIKEFIPENDKDEYKNITGVLKDEVTRTNKIITQFLNYARPLDLKRIDVDTSEYFEDIFNLFSIRAKEKGILLSAENNMKHDINIDPELLKQALINIIQNAFDAVNHGGEVIIKVSEEESKTKIEITDTGCGIQEENIKKIFDLYYTTKRDGNGLGLSIAQKIIDQHSGSIDIESRLNKGTKFIIKLPKA